MNRLILLLALALAGCAHGPSRTPASTASISVAVDCAAKVAPEPVYAADVVGLDGTVFVLVQALLIDREQRKATEAELRAALRGCS